MCIRTSSLTEENPIKVSKYTIAVQLKIKQKNTYMYLKLYM